jgi:hypothetical protein
MEKESSCTSAVTRLAGEESRSGERGPGVAGGVRRRRRVVDGWGIKNDDDQYNIDAYVDTFVYVKN